MVTAQQPTPVGQADPVPLQGHDLVIGDQPQHPTERVLVGADGCGKLGHRQRPSGQPLGDLQPGDRAQAVPQQAEVDHLDQGLPVCRWVPSHGLGKVPECRVLEFPWGRRLYRWISWRFSVVAASLDRVQVDPGTDRV
jgi:hypothetical protein